MKLPHSLLLDPQSGKAAAYTPNHRLIVEEASARLKDYAKAHVGNEAPFDLQLHAAGAPEWRPLPAWATDDVLSQLRLVWISKPDAEDVDGWGAFPRR